VPVSSELSQIYTELSPILVTGGTTGTGRRLVAALLERGGRVRCLIHTPSHRDRLPEHAHLEILLGSAANPADLDRAFQGVRTLIHLAGHRLVPALFDFLEQDAFREAPPTPLRFLFQSSTRLLSQYSTPTRESVRQAEARIQSARVERVAWTILRPAMIYGGHDRNFEVYLATLRRWPFFPIFGSGDCLRQPLFVDDLVTAHLLALETPVSIGQVYTLAGPEPVRFRAMIESIARAAGLRGPRFLVLPYGPCLAAAHALRKVWRGSPVNPEIIERFGEDMVFDIGPARRDLGFSPTSLERALQIRFTGRSGNTP
jgi:nucleoside-diphosphate-sugar epimerase